MKSYLHFGILCLLLPLAVQAQPDESYNFNPERPGFTYGSTPLIRHTISAETYVRVDGVIMGVLGMTNHYTFRYSPLDCLELGIGVGLGVDFTGHDLPPGSYEKPASPLFLSPLSVMTRINILKKHDHKPGLALIGELGLPVGSRDLFDEVSPGVIPTAMAILDHNYKRVGFFYNVGATWNVYAFNTTLFYSFMCRVQANDRGRFHFYGEVMGENKWYVGETGAYNLYTFRVGGDYFICKNFKADFSLATKMNLYSYGYLQAEIGLAYGIPLRKASVR